MVVLEYTDLSRTIVLQRQRRRTPQALEVSPMNRNLTRIVIPAFFLTALGVPAAAVGDSPPFAAEVESCIAAVDAQLDLTDARRVRHFVSEAKSTGLGYALTIETSVLSRGVDAEAHYESFCIAHGANEPSTLRVEAIEA
jgi:hypothetical protein